MTIDRDKQIAIDRDKLREFDNWLMLNPDITQDERESVVEYVAVREYVKRQPSKTFEEFWDSPDIVKLRNSKLRNSKK